MAVSKLGNSMSWPHVGLWGHLAGREQIIKNNDSTPRRGMWVAGLHRLPREPACADGPLTWATTTLLER